MKIPNVKLTKKEKKPLYKIWWVWLIILFILGGIMNGVESLSENDENDIEAEETNVEKPAKKVSSDKKKDSSIEEAVVEEKSTIKIDEKDILKEKIKTVFTTGLEEPEPQISKEDYEKYRDIMNYLYDYPDKEESILFKELESEYNDSAENLEKFVMDNMKNAQAYESGKSVNDVTLKESDIKMSIENFFKENAKNNNKLKINTDKIDVDIINLRSISKGELSYNNHSYNYIIKTEHTVDFQEVEVFQLKLNGVNIDFE